jgi:hypothetical protein
VPDSVFLGFCAKRRMTAPFAGQVRQIASVSECLAKRPDDWVQRWDFNRATCWNTEAEAWACVPGESQSDFSVFAYRIVASRPLDDVFPKDLPALPQEPARLPYNRIGYDVVERNAATGMLGFGCSPLSCNGMADNIPVNEFCLLDDLELALSTARRFDIEKPEPGPYVVIEVLAPL